MSACVSRGAELLGLSDRRLGRLWAVDHQKPPDTSGHFGVVSPQVITGYASSCEVVFPLEISLLRQRFGVRVPGGAPHHPSSGQVSGWASHLVSLLGPAPGPRGMGWTRPKA